MKAPYTYLQPTPDVDGGNTFYPVVGGPTPESYVIVIHGTVEIDDGAPVTSILEAIWSANNLDTRPRGQEIRSMCVGDIVIVGAEIHRAVIVGFEKLPEAEAVMILAGRTLVRGKLVDASSTPMEDHYYEALPVFRR